MAACTRADILAERSSVVLSFSIRSDVALSIIALKSQFLDPETRLDGTVQKFQTADNAPVGPIRHRRRRGP